uniref:RNA-directed DNA polymerase (Reverse transcriptase) n=1 Tax=Medicago truncatula TaxID=3880 RepID=A2Q4X5_MEDTR|nr:RNA-directed DNA polymerase (Reverse transcriptase) [Medicago truncatula]
MCVVNLSRQILTIHLSSQILTIHLQRGLRQGDPLSPFLLAAEGFDVLMKASMANNIYHAYGVGSRREVTLSHLRFADDTLILGEKSWLNVHTIQEGLLLFEQMSGLKVNYNKSMLTEVNIPLSWLSEAASVSNCRTGLIPFVYLGLPIGGDDRKLNFWKLVVDKITAKLLSWNNKFLSFGGRLVLLKSVMSSLPVYFLSFFKAPTGIVSSIESILFIFLNCGRGGL